MESIRKLRNKVDHEQNIVEERQSSINEMQDKLHVSLYTCQTWLVLNFFYKKVIASCTAAGQKTLDSNAKGKAKVIT